MAAAAILALDQGTTNTKALLFAGDGALLAQASRSVPVAHPRPGWAEQSAEDIWRSTQAVIAEVAAKAGGRVIAAIGISNQRESVVLWEAATGRPLGPCILWQCRRTSDHCAALRAQGVGEMLVERTGLGIDPLFSATKLAWLLDAVPDGRRRAAAGELRAGTIDSWLLWNLTGGVHATDHGNASRTQLLDLSTGAWDPSLAALFGVPLEILPEVRSSDSLFGVTREGAVALPAGVPVHAMMGDSHAALHGHGIGGGGRAKVTLGTGSSLMVPTVERARSRSGLSGTIAWSRDGRILYALEGNITVSAHAAAFTARLLGLADEEALTALAASVPDSGDVIFLPALAGLGAPHWHDAARGTIANMSLGTTPAHVARACLEGIALQIRDVAAAAEADLGRRIDMLSVDGGASRNDLLLQMIADILDCPVVRSDATEMSGRGAASLAATGLGIAMARPMEAARFTPRMDVSARTALLTRWSRTIENARRGSGAVEPGTA